MTFAGELGDAFLAILGDYIDPAQVDRRIADTWDSLPGLYRRSDDGTLRALVDAIITLPAVLELFVDAINYVPPDEGGTDTGSLLTDPDRTLWPAWLAQAVGVDLAAAGVLNPAALVALTGRGDAVGDLIRTPVNGWRAGSAGALEAAGRRTLTGARTIRVRALHDEDPFVITVSTAAAETPDPDALRAALEAVLPAGHKLALDNNVGNWRGVEAPGSWGALHDEAPTWADVEQLYEPAP